MQPAMSAEQVTASNQAVTDFTAGQQAQQSGDNAAALAKYEAALPAIREAVRVQPANMEMVSFLANTLYAAAAAKAGLQQMDAVAPLFQESLPLWRKVVSAKPDDMAATSILAGILTQLGNVKLSQQDKAGAATLYAEALPLARKVAGEQPAAPNKNLLFSTLVGASQASEDAAIQSEVKTMAETMISDGSIDAANRPAAEVLAGAQAAAQ